MNSLLAAMEAALDDAQAKGQAATLNVLPYALAAWRERLEDVRADALTDRGMQTRAERTEALARELCWDARVKQEYDRVTREAAYE